MGFERKANTIVLRFCISAILISALPLSSQPALADNEVGNVAHVAAGPYGRCYAKSVPAHGRDPYDQVRQQGTTKIYRVGQKRDTLVNIYDWFAQTIFLDCNLAGDPIVVRIGPWNRGHNPRNDHLAIAFYTGGELIKSYSTLDIAGDEPSDNLSFSKYKNVSASVFHYTVFDTEPTPDRIIETDGAVFREKLAIEAVTIDGRRLVFDPRTGEIR